MQLSCAKEAEHKAEPAGSTSQSHLYLQAIFGSAETTFTCSVMLANDSIEE